MTKFSRLNRDEHFEIHKLEAVECLATRVKCLSLLTGSRVFLTSLRLSPMLTLLLVAQELSTLGILGLRAKAQWFGSVKLTKLRKRLDLTLMLVSVWK